MGGDDGNGNISLFKMVISSTTPNTAKTLSTLKHDLDFSQYERIIILDDDGANIWCHHEMDQLYEQHRVNIILDQVSKYSVWSSVYRQFDLLASSRLIPNIYKTHPHIVPVIVRQLLCMEYLQHAIGKMLCA